MHIHRFINYGYILLILVSLCLSAVCQAQVKPVSLSDVDSLMAKEPKLVLILLTTNWCTYCHAQKRQIKKNKTFGTKSNLFYYVEFDAESKESIVFQGKEYHFQPTGIGTGIHELAPALLEPERLAFPTWILLDKNYYPLLQYSGILTTKALNKLMNALEKIPNY